MATNNAQNGLSTTMQDDRDADTTAAESAIDKLGAAADQALSAVQTTILPALADAKDRVTPALEEAKQRLAPIVEEARNAIVPVAAEAIAAGKAKGKKAAMETEATDGEPKKKKHRLRKLLVVLGIAAAATFVYKKLNSGKEPTWVASPDSSGSGSPDSSADKSETAPTAPLASEETVESPVPTTPDQPLEEHQV